MIEITKADRELLAEIVVGGFTVHVGPKGSGVQHIPEGMVLSAIAKARQQGREDALREAAAVADRLFYPDETKRSAQIRDAILALIDKEPK